MKSFSADSTHWWSYLLARYPEVKLADLDYADDIAFGLGWTVEEAEVAARERIMWRYLSNQVISAAMHDVNQLVSMYAIKLASNQASKKASKRYSAKVSHGSCPSNSPLQHQVIPMPKGKERMLQEHFLPDNNKWEEHSTRRWLHQWVLSTEDDFNECYLLKMTSSMGDIYWRWLLQWVLSTEDDFINGWYLLKMTSQWVQSTEGDFNEWYLLKMTSSMGAIYWRWLLQWVLYLLKMTSSMSSIYWKWLRVLWKWFYQWVLSNEDDFINEC